MYIVGHIRPQSHMANRSPASASIEMMLDDPDLRLRLAYSWPKPRCACGAAAQAVFCVKFTCPDCDDVEDWYEYRLGCQACFFSAWGKGVKCERELPMTRMFVRVKRADGDHTFPITVPVKHKKVSIGMVLPLTCISQASPGIQEMLGYRTYSTQSKGA